MSESIAPGAVQDPVQWSFETERSRAGRTTDGTHAPALPVQRTGSHTFGDAARDGSALHSRVATIGDVRPLVIHRASMTHSQLTLEAQLVLGVASGPVRSAVGVGVGVGVETMPTDLRAGFAAAAT
ncbi:PLP-dependent transferase [Streptomyces gardneri]|nr:PLP-dependent transferase [Streptomyces gardneri]